MKTAAAQMNSARRRACRRLDLLALWLGIGVAACEDAGEDEGGPCEFVGVDDPEFVLVDSKTEADVYAVDPVGSASHITAVGVDGTAVYLDMVSGDWPWSFEVALGQPVPGTTLRATGTEKDRDAGIQDYGYLVAVGDAGTVVRTPRDSEQWEHLDPGTTADLRGVAQLNWWADEESGLPPITWLAVGQSTVVRRTDVTSPQGFDLIQLPASYDLWSVSAESREDGPIWAVGDAGLVLWSRDAGVTWEQYEPLPTAADLRLVSAPRRAVDALYGGDDWQPLWVGGLAGELWRKDVYDDAPIVGEASDTRWLRESIPTEAHLSSMTFGPMTAWVAGTSGVLLRRVEQGPWELFDTPAGGVAFRASVGFDAWAGQMHVGDRGTMLAVYTEFHYAGDCVADE